MDVILLASYVLVTKLLSFVCKRVYGNRGVGQIVRSSSSGERVGHKIRKARGSWKGEAVQRHTDSIEVLYVHATIKLKVVQRVSRGSEERKNGFVFIAIFPSW